MTNKSAPTLVPYERTLDPCAITLMATTPSGRTFLAAVWARTPVEAKSHVEVALRRHTREINGRVALTSIPADCGPDGVFMCPVVDVSAARLLVEHEPPTSTTALLLEMEAPSARAPRR